MNQWLLAGLFWATAMDVSKHAMTEQKAKSECKVLSEKVESLISALPSAKSNQSHVDNASEADLLLHSSR